MYLIYWRPGVFCCSGKNQDKTQFSWFSRGFGIWSYLDIPNIYPTGTGQKLNISYFTKKITVYSVNFSLFYKKWLRFTLPTQLLTGPIASSLLIRSKPCWSNWVKNIVLGSISDLCPIEICGADPDEIPNKHQPPSFPIRPRDTR